MQACKLCADVGADFVMTSTGLLNVDESVQRIRLIRNAMASSVSLAVSGGETKQKQAKALIEAGADRLGISVGVKL